MNCFTGELVCKLLIKLLIPVLHVLLYLKYNFVILALKVVNQYPNILCFALKINLCLYS